MTLVSIVHIKLLLFKSIVRGILINFFEKFGRMGLFFWLAFKKWDKGFSRDFRKKIKKEVGK